MVQPKDPQPELDPDLAEHLFGHVESTGKRPAPKVRVARERKEIQIGPDVMRVVDESIEAIAADPRTFSRANELVTVIGAPPDVPRSSVAAGTPIIRHIAPPTMVERLTSFARFVKFSGKTKEWIEVPPPASVVGALLARGDWAGVRPLAGVTEVPLFREDGTVRQERGYDAATGYVYLPSADYPPVAEYPTKIDAERALEKLEDIFCDFPYVDRSHKMVPIAAILTLLARAAIRGPVPSFIFDASTRGSGKTLQADLVHLIAFGRSAARQGYPKEDDELEKVLSSCAIFGARCILLDNLTRAFGGGPIDRVITARDDVEFRMLGTLAMMRLPWHAVIMVSGNNVALGDDTTRRVLVARLESPLENPETRTDFRYELPDDAIRMRPELVHAALTILRAYSVVGRPDAQCPRWGSFEAWSRLIPHAIVFAGGVDPMQARPRGDGALTDDTAALSVVLRELPRLDADGTGLTSKGIITLLFDDRRHPDESGPDGWEALREAIEQWTVHRPNQRPTAGALGKKLSGYEGKVQGGRRLRSRPLDGRRLWYVEILPHG